MAKNALKKTVVAVAVSLSMLLTQVGTTFAAPPNVVNPKYTWNLQDIFPNEDAFLKACNKVGVELPKTISELKKDLSTPSKVYKLMKALDTADILDNQTYWYANFACDLDITDEHALDLQAKATSADDALMSVEANIEPQLLGLSEDYLKGLMDNPYLKDYKQYFRSLLARKPHVLSADKEEVLAALTSTTGQFYTIWDNIVRGDYKSAKIVDPDGKPTSSYNIFTSLEIPRDFKQKTFDTVYGNFALNKNTLAAVMNADVNKNVIIAHMRNYESGLDSALADENIPRSVYDNLLETVNKKLDVEHKLTALKKKIAVKAGYVKPEDKIHFYDTYASVVDPSVAAKMAMPFEKGKQEILEGLKPLGEEYINGLKAAFDGRWLDVYPNAHKYTGGYNLALYGVHPYILLNYYDDMDSMLTCAHELGHAMNGVYYGKYQPYKNAHITKFNGEVASTANELMMTDYEIGKVTNDEEKLYLIDSLINTIDGTVFTQVAFSEFEKAMYDKVEQGGALTANFLNKTYTDIWQKYLGPDMQVDPSYGIYWSRISHFYRNFYTFKYSTAMAASFELTKQMKEDKTGQATKRYMEFLKAGISDFPVDVLKKAGVDMTKSTAVENLIDYMSKLIDEEEALLKKMGRI